MLCGKQNIALRGHRDDSSYIDEASGNPGNFQALLNFRVEAGDKVLANHFANAKRNATYCSKTIQNEIIEVLGTYIQDKITTEINEAGASSLLADEASDSSNKEQLPLVLRFFNKERNVREEFVGFYECGDGITDQAIGTLIMKAVQELGLSMDYCEGQCYVGAGNMSGPCNGAGAIVRRQFKLLDVCKTHWIQRIDGLEVFLELYEAIVGTLETIKPNAERSWNADSTKKAVSHYHAIANFDSLLGSSSIR